ncbi:MAG: metal-dependent phosphohydrolase, partial [Acidiferrobacteraceae bacterium]
MDPWILTHSGRMVDLMDPQPSMIDFGDIAWALSQLCRYTGHTRYPYSVAQHSVLVSHHVPKSLEAQALMHDAQEAYIGDLSSPLKRLVPEYGVIEDRVAKAIAERFGLPEKLDESVKRADLQALMTERRDLMHPGGDPWCITESPWPVRIIRCS